MTGSRWSKRFAIGVTVGAALAATSTLAPAVSAAPAAAPAASAGLATVAAAPTGGRCAPLAPAGRPLRVTFVGDSMTHSRSGSASYRYWVWRGLRSAGADVQFVGTREEPNRTPVGLAPRRAYEHVDHGFAANLAHSGRARRTFATTPDTPGVVSRLGADLIVLQLGYNDANYEEAPLIARRTAAYVNEIWRLDAEQQREPTRFVLGQIPLAGRSFFRPLAEKNRVTARANRLIAQQLARPCLVEINTLRDARGALAWQPRPHTYDGTHPNPVGETLMAQRMLDAMARIGVVRSSPRVFRPAETWEPRPTIRGDRTADGRVRLRWAAEKVRVGADLVRLRIVPPRGRATTTPPLAGDRAVRRLAPGTRVRLVAMRGGAPGTTMVSRPGPAYTVPR